jgi:hypothetical protein
MMDRASSLSAGVMGLFSPAISSEIRSISRKLGTVLVRAAIPAASPLTVEQI